MSKVTIIVPIYNVEEYVAKCLIPCCGKPIPTM